MLKLGGKTLIELAIDLALTVVSKDKIIFSSDSDEYLKKASKKGVVIKKRSDDLANEHVGKIEVFKSLMKFSDSKYFIDIDVTAPIRDRSDVIELYKALLGKDIAFAGVKMESINPYFNMVEVKEGGRLGTVSQGGYKRTQDVPNVFLLNSLMGWERNYLINCASIFDTVNWGMHIMTADKMFDIDNYLDYEIIKAIYKAKK